MYLLMNVEKENRLCALLGEFILSHLTNLAFYKSRIKKKKSLFFLLSV